MGIALSTDDKKKESGEFVETQGMAATARAHAKKFMQQGAGKEEIDDSLADGLMSGTFRWKRGKKFIQLPEFPCEGGNKSQAL